MEKQQTAVEWLEQQIENAGISHFFNLTDLFDQAKQLERKQIIDWWDFMDEDCTANRKDYTEQEQSELLEKFFNKTH